MQTHCKNAEILCIGTELLMGNIVNTNAAYIAKELASLGVNVYYQSVVGDNPERLKKSLELAFSRADTVITTGGLGPTYDDLTKETIAEYFGRKLVLHQPSYDKLCKYFAATGRKITDNNKKQAFMPEGCRVFDNPNGTAPGCCIQQDGRTLIMLPGPPREMKPMFDPRLQHVRPIPPHERKALMRVEFDDNDWTTLQEVFGDSDSAAAAASIILDSPPEIQILAAQIINMIQKEAA